MKWRAAFAAFVKRAYGTYCTVWDKNVFLFWLCRPSLSGFCSNSIDRSSNRCSCVPLWGRLSAAVEADGPRLAAGGLDGAAAAPVGPGQSAERGRPRGRALSSRHVPRAAARRGKNKSRSPAGRRGAQARCGGEHRCVAAAQFGTPIGGGTSASDLPWIGGLSAVDRWWIGGGSKVDRWWIDVGSVAQVCSRAKQKNSAPPAELAGEAEGRPDSDGPCERAWQRCCWAEHHEKTTGRCFTFNVHTIINYYIIVFDAH